MRVLAVHPGCAFSVADVYEGWVEGLGEIGCTVGAFDLEARLRFYTEAHLRRDGEWTPAFDRPEAVVEMLGKSISAACYEFAPDVVLVVSAFYVPLGLLDIIRARGTKVVLHHTEEPYQLERELARAGHADLNLINDPTHLEAFRAVAPTVYMPHAYRPPLHRPRPASPDLVSDFAFCGTGYESRIAFLEAVDFSGIDVALAGNWMGTREDSPLRRFLVHDVAECFLNGDTADLYASTKASMNLYRREADRPELAEGWACGPREIELAASATFFLREPRGESDELFGMLPTFDGPEDFGQKLRWWLQRDDMRAEATSLARAAVADRTFGNHAAQLLRLLNRLDP